LKIFAVVNPVSNGGKTASNWPKFFDYFTGFGLRIEYKYTEYRGHAEKIAADALKNNYKYIMVVGGDGTVNEVVNAVYKDDKLINNDFKLIVFAQGTGSDLIRSLNISNKPEEMIKIIKRKNTMRIDLLKVDFLDYSGLQKSRYFVNASDCGFGAEAAARVNSSGTFFDGKLTYLKAVFLSLINYSNKHAAVIVDGEKFYSGLLNTAVAANGKYFGGGIKIAPNSDLRSGSIEFLLLKNFSRSELIFNLIKAYRGTHLSHPKVESFSAEKIEIISEEKMNLEVDGENIGTTPAVFSILKSKLPVLI